MSDFFSKTGSDTFSSVLKTGKEQESRKKFITVKKIHLAETVWLWKHVFLDIEKSNSKRLFSNYSKHKTGSL